jgi:outer membrane protein TolC
MKIRWSVLAMFLLLPASAQAQGVVRLTLDEAIARAGENSMRLAELQARSEAAEASVAGRRAAGRPVVAVVGGYTRTNHVPEFSIPLPGQPIRTIYPDIPDN